MMADLARRKPSQVERVLLRHTDTPDHVVAAVERLSLAAVRTGRELLHCRGVATPSPVLVGDAEPVRRLMRRNQPVRGL